MDGSEPALKISETKILVTLVIFIIFFRIIGIYFQNRYVSVGLNISKNVTLVVLGDIGRSPRMQYHALSFAQNGWTVDFVGYDGKLSSRLNVINLRNVQLNNLFSIFIRCNTFKFHHR